MLCAFVTRRVRLRSRGAETRNATYSSKTHPEKLNRHDFSDVQMRQICEPRVPSSQFRALSRSSKASLARRVRGDRRWRKPSAGGTTASCASGASTARLGSSRARCVCCTARPTGVETIKNLVLGGIHSFTLVDDALVTPRDLGNNFFVHESDLGKGRAAAVAAHLHELNTSVAGAFVDESVDVVVDQNPDFFKDFTVVVASRVEMKTLAKLDEACRARDVALVALDTLGLVGTVRLSKTEHRVLEAKPEETDFDLRVNAPWPALIDFAKRFAAGGGGDALRNDAHARAHIPWAVTLVNVVEELGMRGAPAAAWNAERRAAAKAAIKAAFRSPAPSGDDAEAEATLAALGDAVLPENATEALAAARHCWKAPGAVPPALAETLSDPRLDALDADAPSFWFLLAGLRAFLRGEGGGARAPRRRRRARHP